MSEQKLITKIENLFKLAESTTHDEERDAFLKKANELLEKYAIDQELLFQSDRSKVTIEIISDYFNHTATSSAVKEWKRSLIGAVGPFFNCTSLLAGSLDGIFVGRRDDTEMAKSLLFSLIAQTELACAEKLTEYRRENPSVRIHSRTWYANFTAAASSRLAARLRALKRERDAAQAAQTTNALSVEVKSAITSHLESKYGRITSRSAPDHSTSSSLGLREGRSFGDSARLNPELT